MTRHEAVTRERNELRGPISAYRQSTIKSHPVLVSAANANDEHVGTVVHAVDHQVRLDRVDADRGIDLLAQPRRLRNVGKKLKGMGQQIEIGLGLAFDPTFHGFRERDVHGGLGGGLSLID